MHEAVGLGIVACLVAPFIVGYLDIGDGNEGLAVFTGINYPFWMLLPAPEVAPSATVGGRWHIKFIYNQLVT